MITCQNTQSFSEITAIDTSNKIKITVDIKVFDKAKYQLLINNHNVIKDFTVDLLDPIEIIIHKTGEGLVDIASIILNDCEVMPLYLSHSLPPTNRLTSETTWHLSIKPNFYVWYHYVKGNGWIA